MSLPGHIYTVSKKLTKFWWSSPFPGRISHRMIHVIKGLGRLSTAFMLGIGIANLSHVFFSSTRGRDFSRGGESITPAESGVVTIIIRVRRYR